jgi:hypothetical protein
VPGTADWRSSAWDRSNSVENGYCQAKTDVGSADEDRSNQSEDISTGPAPLVTFRVTKRQVDAQNSLGPNVPLTNRLRSQI